MKYQITKSKDDNRDITEMTIITFTDSEGNEYLFEKNYYNELIESIETAAKNLGLV